MASALAMRRMLWRDAADRLTAEEAEKPSSPKPAPSPEPAKAAD